MAYETENSNHIVILPRNIKIVRIQVIFGGGIFLTNKPEGQFRTRGPDNVRVGKWDEKIYIIKIRNRDATVSIDR